MENESHNGGESGVEKKEKKSKKEKNADKELNKERNVDRLIEQNKGSIEELKEATKDICENDPQYDDIFFLRYVLSNKSTKNAEKSVRDCIEYRKNNSEWLELAKTKGEEAIPFKDKIKIFSCQGNHKSKIGEYYSKKVKSSSTQIHTKLRWRTREHCQSRRWRCPYLFNTFKKRSSYFSCLFSKYNRQRH